MIPGLTFAGSPFAASGAVADPSGPLPNAASFGTGSITLDCSDPVSGASITSTDSPSTGQSITVSAAEE